jgi:hypothetical protein
MSRRSLAFGCVCSIALTLSASAQDASRSPAPQANAAVTVEGCLLREVDVPGRQPPENERARVRADDEYVLTDTKMIKGTAPSAAEASKQDETPTGTSGAARPPLLYKVEEIEKATLAEHKGKRVQIDGSFAHLDRANNRPSAATDLVELRGTAIRPVPGDCPAR